MDKHLKSDPFTKLSSRSFQIIKRGNLQASGPIIYSTGDLQISSNISRALRAIYCYLPSIKDKHLDSEKKGLLIGSMSRSLLGERAIVRNTDMDESMQSLAIELAGAAIEKYTIEKDAASHIKKEFDKRYGPTWHCVVGRNFGR